MRKKFVFFAIAAGSLMLAGCQNKSAAVSSTEAAAKESSDAAESSETTGRVTEISDTEITLAAGFGGGGGRPSDGRGQGENGEKPSGGRGQGQKENGGKPADGQKQGQGQAPSGEAPSGDRLSGDRPSGDRPSGQAREPVTFTLTSATEFFNSEGAGITAADIKEGDMVTVNADAEHVALTVTISSMPDRTGQGGPDGQGGGQSAPETYEAATEYSEDTETTGETYSSTGKDESAVHIMNGAAVVMEDFTLTRKSSDSTGGDQSSFYGVGAGILVTDGTADISGASIDTDAAGGAGVFSYGTGVVNLSDSTIRTSQDTSGGIHVAGGGTLHAENLTVETQGESSAAIRSDRGSGVMTVKGGSYTSNGSGSPAVYSTADITVQDAELTANGAEAVCIEGLNSLKLTNCNLTGNIPENEQNDCNWTVILYQSMSGDSEVGNSTFEMTGGTLTSKNGGLFYTTNTESSFYLNHVKLTGSESNDFLLKCTGNANQRGWGEKGANGADCVFKTDSQTMDGDIIWDSISTLEFTMENGSRLTGAFLKDESNAGTGGDGYANLTIDGSSTWTVTEDSVLSSLQCAGTILGADKKSVSIVGADGTVFEKGEGTYTVTVISYQHS